MHIHTCIRMYMDKYTAFSNPAPTTTPALPKGQTHEGLWGDFHRQIFPRGPAPTFISQHTRPPREQKPLGNFCQIISALALAWGPRAATRFPQGGMEAAPGTAVPSAAPARYPVPRAAPLSPSCHHHPLPRTSLTASPLAPGGPGHQLRRSPRSSAPCKSPPARNPGLGPPAGAPRLPRLPPPLP